MELPGGLDPEGTGGRVGGEGILYLTTPLVEYTGVWVSYIYNWYMHPGYPHHTHTPHPLPPSLPFGQSVSRCLHSGVLSRVRGRPRSTHGRGCVGVGGGGMFP